MELSTLLETRAWVEFVPVDVNFAAAGFFQGIEAANKRTFA